MLEKAIVWFVFPQWVQRLLPLGPLWELLGTLWLLEKLLLEEVTLLLSLTEEKTIVFVGDCEVRSPTNSLSWWSTREKVLTKEDIGSISMTWDLTGAYTSLRPRKKMDHIVIFTFFLKFWNEPTRTRTRTCTQQETFIQF